MQTITIEVGKDGQWFVVGLRGFGIPAGFWFRHAAAEQVRGLKALYEKAGHKVAIKHSDYIGLSPSSHREGLPALPCQ